MTKHHSKLSYDQTRYGYENRVLGSVQSTVYILEEFLDIRPFKRYAHKGKIIREMT